MSVLLTIIVTSYQAENTIARAIFSALKTFRKNEIEIIVVDDCSTDSTVEIIEELQNEFDNIRYFVMPNNTGSPSAPRNFGVKKALGKYITFLDDDDEIIPDRLLNMVDYMESVGADYGKGYLICDTGKERYETNRLDLNTTDKNEVISSMIAVQSTTQDFIVKKSLIAENNIEYRSDLKLGEDTIFVLSVLKNSKKPVYIDNYFLIYYKIPVDAENLSSTQKWGDREVKNQISAWKEAEKISNEMSISYYKLRLHVGFRNLLLSVVRYSSGISENIFNELHDFALQTKKFVSGAMNLSKRYKELYESILSGDYSRYNLVSKRRILINGYDLKFIMPIVKYLENDYIIKIDEWTGHNSHDLKKSKELAEWADIFWCEWMLGNAVFYSKIKNKNQRLVIRAHRFELWREFGFDIDWKNVDMVFTVGYYYFEKFLSKFSIPREKMRLLSNYVEESIYSKNKSDDALNNIGLIGILPKRKGFLKGLQLLKKLNETNPEFRLYIMGKSYNEVDWIKNNPEERKYYELCEKYMSDNNLKDKVIFGGFVEREKLYNNIGYVLSLSDNDAPESFHLAPAEAACGKSMGLLLNWPGVGYIYPKNVIFDDINEIADEILKAKNDTEYYNKQSDFLREYVIENYSLDKFLDNLKKYMIKLMIMR